MNYSILSVVVFFFIIVSIVNAEPETPSEKQTPAEQQAHPEQQASSPITRGMQMQQVEEIAGPALQKVPAVGDPPISRWIYDDFTVYFEGQHVIHTVIKKGK